MFRALEGSSEDASTEGRRVRVGGGEMVAVVGGKMGNGKDGLGVVIVASDTGRVGGTDWIADCSARMIMSWKMLRLFAAL